MPVSRVCRNTAIEKRDDGLHKPNTVIFNWLSKHAFLLKGRQENEVLSMSIRRESVTTSVAIGDRSFRIQIHLFSNRK